MSRSTLPGQGADRASAIATESARISLDRVMLIGTAGAPTDLRALLRLPDGRIAKVETGDRLGSAEIRGIEPDRLSMVVNGRARTLRLP